MRSASSPILAIAASAVAAFGLVTAVFLSPDFAMAADKPQTTSTGQPPQTAPNAAPPSTAATPGKSGGAACTCPPAIDKQKLWPKPKFADYRSLLDETDEVAALESVQLALSEVGDGSTYVWHRGHGRLSGIVQPTSSFRDAAGAVCRHVVVMLTAGPDTKKTEGIACRLADGRWQLEG
jgi:hypothetical protein